MKRVTIHGQVSGIKTSAMALAEGGWLYCLICGRGFQLEPDFLSHMNPHPAVRIEDVSRLHDKLAHSHAFPLWVAGSCQRCGVGYAAVDATCPANTD